MGRECGLRIESAELDLRVVIVRFHTILHKISSIKSGLRDPTRVHGMKY